MGSEMSEHMHKWRPSGSYDDCEWRCECGYILEGDEVTRRLNVTENLIVNWAFLVDSKLPEDVTAKFIYEQFVARLEDE